MEWSELAMQQFNTFNDLLTLKEDSFAHTDTFEITQGLHKQFATLCGAYSPIHDDDEFAQALGLKKSVSFGLLSALLTARIGETVIPGGYGFGYEWSIKLIGSIYVGDMLTLRTTIVELRKSLRTVVINTQVTNQHDENVAYIRVKMKMLK